MSLDAADLDALLALARAHSAAEAQRQAARLRSLVGAGSSIEPHIDALLARADEIEHARQLAMTDALTGIGNRRAFADQLRRELARARRSGSSLAVVLIDLDEFKSVTRPAIRSYDWRRAACVRSRARKTSSRVWAVMSSRCCCPVQMARWHARSANASARASRAWAKTTCTCA
jgi:predicted signal transduction protein with EAL and GGDEF domain